VHIVQDQEQRPVLRQGMQHMGDFFKDAPLVGAGLLAFGLAALCQFLEPLALLRCDRFVNGCPAQEQLSGDKHVDEMAAVHEQGLDHVRQEAPQAERVLARDAASSPALLDVAGERAQDLAEGQVGVAHVRISGADAGRDDQAGVLLLGAAGEFRQEARLSPAGFSAHECNLASPTNRGVHESFQLLQLRLAADEGLLRSLRGLCGFVQKCRAPGTRMGHRRHMRSRGRVNGRRLQVAPADALAEAVGFLIGLDGKIRGQLPAADLILGQGRAPLSADGQPRHQAPVRVLA